MVFLWFFNGFLLFFMCFFMIFYGFFMDWLLQLFEGSEL